MIVWYNVKGGDECRAKIRLLMPKSWRPPRDDDRLVKAQLEGPEELAKLMTKAPGNYRGED